MYGNQLNYMQTCWTVGYVIGEIPSNLLLTRVRPRYWIPAAEVTCHSYLERHSSSLLTYSQLLWTVLTFSMSRCNTSTQFYVLRFFVG